MKTKIKHWRAMTRGQWEWRRNDHDREPPNVMVTTMINPPDRIQGRECICDGRLRARSGSATMLNVLRNDSPNHRDESEAIAEARNVSARGGARAEHNGRSRFAKHDL